MDLLSGGLQTPSALLLIGVVTAIGILHTAVPDHWLPIALLARQNGWSRAETARAAAQAGTGHVLSTLVIGLVVWLVGAAAAQRFGGAVDTIASLALILFGGWVAVMGFLELRGGHDHEHGHAHAHDHDHDHDHGHDEQLRHAHWHRHSGRAPHLHAHVHTAATAHAVAGTMVLDPPFHDHSHRATGRGALLVILGSSPMIEGIPAFFAASRLGLATILIMAALFAASTVATYVALCVYSTASLQRMSLGPVERYGEVLSGAVIAAVGIVFWLWPVL